MVRGRPKKNDTDENIYKVVLTSNNKEYFGSGKNVYEALSAIPLHFLDLNLKQ